MVLPFLKKPSPMRLIRALKGEVTSEVPFWYMRQAGRYLPEYRDLRMKAGSFLDLCFNPELAMEATLQPIRRYDMDAAIIFSDILVIPYALGQRLDFIEKEGPKLDPIQERDAFLKLNFDMLEDKLSPVYEALKLTRAALDPSKALIGFAGAPWTVACYMVEGEGGGEFPLTRQIAFDNPEIFDILIDKIVTATTTYLLRQIESGADAVQLFDSWAGLLPEPYFTRWVIKPAKKIADAIDRAHKGFPIIGFPRGAGERYVPFAKKTGIRAIALDQNVPLPWAREMMGSKVTLQGNLDPTSLLSGGKRLYQDAMLILEACRHQPFVFNLGHGIQKETPPEHVAELSQIIKNFKR